MEADGLRREPVGVPDGDAGTIAVADLVGVVGVGVDLVEVPRLQRALDRQPRLKDRLFTSGERRYAETARSPVQCARRYAVRFAAKEAAMKTLGVGLGGIGWHDVEILRAPTGEPTLQVAGRAEALASQRGGTRWLVSLSHTDHLAQATVLLVAS